jgi:hypothetical protein
MAMHHFFCGLMAMYHIFHMQDVQHFLKGKIILTSLEVFLNITNTPLVYD